MPWAGRCDATAATQGLNPYLLGNCVPGDLERFTKIAVAFLLACFARGGVTKIRHIWVYAYIFVPCHEQTRYAKFTTSILQNALAIELGVKCDVARWEIDRSDEFRRLGGTVLAVHSAIFPLHAQRAFVSDVV